MNILVSTPGRLVDHLGKTESLRVDHVEWVVLDEADRMLELGYERDVRAVLDALQQKNQLMRQSVLLSATLTQVDGGRGGMVVYFAVTIGNTPDTDFAGYRISSRIAGYFPNI